MNYPKPTSVTARLAPLCALLLLSACSGPQEDVRFSYCRNLIEVRLDSSQTIQWKGSESEIHRPEYAKITLSFETAQGDTAAVPMQAACFYKYDTTDENVMTHSTPLAAYATVPYRITVNGKEVAERVIHEAIKDAALKQGRELVEGVRKGVEEATR